MMPFPMNELYRRFDAALVRARSVLLYSDFDGTLTPIRSHPDECRLESGLRRTLAMLAQHPRVRIGVISGRRLEDLQKRVGVPEVFYAGNHGLEIQGPGLDFRVPEARGSMEALERLLAILSPSLSRIPGAWIENKGLSASVHFRDAASEDVPRLEGIVKRIVTPCISDGVFVLRAGKAVLEVRPAVAWNKASAIRWLEEQGSVEESSSLRLYFGDDETDEDVFSAFPEGFTVCVGKRLSTKANFRAREPAEIRLFLEWLSKRMNVDGPSSVEESPGFKGKDAARAN